MGISRRLALAPWLVLLVFAASCSSTGLPLASVPPTPSAIAATAASTLAPAGNFVLTSSAFPDDGAIPKKYSCDGERISPPLKWSGAPAGTKSFALIVDDPDAPGGTFTHWIVFDLPATQNEIPEAASSVGKGGLNGTRQIGYTGPCPPSGTHRYFFTLYAVDVASLGLNDGATRADVDKALQSHTIAQTQLMGKYSR
jgi:Raf kinase inhibitor-like YbhB/YbcL family protein